MINKARKKSITPPEPGATIFRLLYSDEFSSTLISDIEDEYRIIYAEKNKYASYIWYHHQLIIALLSVFTDSFYRSAIMLKNYFKIALRNLRRNKVYSFINIFGLAIGITSSLLISIYIFDEISYDRFHEKADRIYRICMDFTGDGDFRIHQLGTPRILATTIREKYPDVETIAQLYYFKWTLTKCGEKAFKNETILYTEPDFFKVFSFPLIKGDPEVVLSEPNSAVITRTAAEKYFGEEDPVGKRLSILFNMRVEFDVTITGIVEDVPENSHIDFNLLVSINTIEDSERWNAVMSNNWYSDQCVSYVTLREGVTLDRGEEMLMEIMHSVVPEGNHPVWTLQPLKDIHLHTDLATGYGTNGNAIYIYLFSVIAVLIIIIACINFVNLSTAISYSRAREIGIRKVAGSLRRDIIKQFLGEAVMICSISLILALLLTEFLLPFFSNLVGSQLELLYFQQWYVIPGLIGFVLLSGFFAGIYPAFFLSAFGITEVLKNTLSKRGKKGLFNLRNGLITFQFLITAFLIIGTMIVYKQLDHFQNNRLGFDKDRILIIHQTDALDKQVPVLKENLRRSPDIEYLSSSTFLPGYGFWNFGVRVGPQLIEGKNNTLDMTVCDHDYLKTFNMQMAEGRFFSRDISTDTAAIVINEKTVEYFELKNPIGKRITVWGFNRKTFEIIGVIRDFHYKSMHLPIRRMGMTLSGTHPHWIDQYVSIKLKSENISKTLDFINNTWDEVSPGLKLEYTFFDEDYDRLYKAESLTGNVIALFSCLAILISIIGLFGLTAYIAEQKTKEIGVRKVLGANAISIVNLMVKEYIFLICIANLIAWPAAFYAANRWLEQFAYKTDINITVFIISSFVVVLISIIAVCFQTIRAANTDPVNSLRNE